MRYDELVNAILYIGELHGGPVVNGRHFYSAKWWHYHRIQDCINITLFYWTPWGRIKSMDVILIQLNDDIITIFKTA